MWIADRLGQKSCGKVKVIPLDLPGRMLGSVLCWGGGDSGLGCWLYMGLRPQSTEAGCAASGSQLMDE